MRTPWTITLNRPLEWEPLDDGTIRLRDPSRDTWVRTKAWTRPILEALDGGADAAFTRRARRFLLSLEKVGYVTVEVPVPHTLGDWDVVEELGRGGVGIAYACRRDGQDAVAKVPWDFLYDWDEVAASIHHEADVLGRLDHPSVVRRFDLFDDAERPVLVRQRADGPSLTDQHDGDPADAATAARITGELAALMQHLHARDHVLIDYKPTNFVRDDTTGVLVLVDAGHCRRIGARRVGGTPGFMPPELAAREPATVASDVWGLGRLYAFLLSGRLPGSRSDVPVVDGVPEGHVKVVETLCADAPADRPATVADALALIERSPA